MRGDASAYSVLGIKPGADQATIDRAYRELIKRHHPDRQGGDAGRAAEINQAYFALRKSAAQAPQPERPQSVAEALYARRAAQLQRRRSRSSARPWLLVLVGAMLILAWKRDEVAIFAQDGWAAMKSGIEPPAHHGTDLPSAGRTVSLDAPINELAVTSSVGQAVALHRSGKADALAEHSRICHQQLRAGPTLDGLDQCAAFDHAVLELQQRDPIADDGPFSASAVTSRQISAANLLTDDFVAIEGRLDRVRRRVQLLLAPPAPLPPQPFRTGSNPADAPS